MCLCVMLGLCNTQPSLDISNIVSQATLVTAIDNVFWPLQLFEIQVVFSSEGKIVGFQPLSLVAVNHWATNPLARELYGGKKLTPGMFYF